MNKLAGSNIGITDNSSIVGTGSTGICCVLGQTERGPVNTPTRVGSWFEYQRTFGGLLTTSDFPLLCKRALDGGATLQINRVAHYGDLTDGSTLTGTKAASTTVFKAKNVGAWGNGLTVTVTDNLSSAAKVNVKVSLQGYPQLAYTVEGITKVLTVEDIARFNASSDLLDLTATAGATLGTAVYALTGGVETDAVTSADFIGHAATATGIFAFDAVQDAHYIAAPEKATNALDLALAAYADGRGDLRPILRTPVGLTKNGIKDYRNATGAYAGQAVNSWRSLLFTGGLRVTHPTTSTAVQISEIGDVIARISQKDTRGNVWDAFSGERNGKVANTLGVVVNYGAPSYASDASELVALGVNPVIQHSTFGVCLWGNRSLSLETGKMLFYAHVGDIVMHLQRFCKPRMDEALFEPNDVPTWRDTYHKIQPELERLKTGKAIVAYEYMGDQYVDDRSKVKVNNVADLDAGQYKAVLRIYPLSKLEFFDLSLDIINGAVRIDVQA